MNVASFLTVDLTWLWMWKVMDAAGELHNFVLSIQPTRNFSCDPIEYCWFIMQMECCISECAIGYFPLRK